MSQGYSGAYSNVKVATNDVDAQGWSADVESAGFDSTTTADAGWEDETTTTSKVTGTFDILYNKAKKPFGTLGLTQGATVALTLYVNEPDGDNLAGSARIQKMSLKTKVKDGFLVTCTFTSKGVWTLPSYPTGNLMDLTKFTDRPELTVPIAGRAYHFSEIPITGLADLQDYLRRTVPHPLEALKGHLDGFSDRDRDRLLDEARAAAAKWPPQMGTAEGAAALLSSEAGQVEALRVGLLVHQPETTPTDAGRLFRELRKQTLRDSRAAKRAGKRYDGEGVVGRIYAVIFGLDPDAEPVPES